MLIQKIIGNIASFEMKDQSIDWLKLEWYEAEKKILRKRTESGKEVALKFITGLTQGDILYADEQTVIAVDILPCDCIVILPKNMFEMASACYEIGNKHLPLFFEENSLLVPFEQPLYRLLMAQNYEVKQEKRKLLKPLKTSVSPHEHSSESLFSKIMKMTHSNE